MAKPHQNKDEEEKNIKLHIVMFPWLAFGHMIPFLELSKSLAEKGHQISFISTPKNIQRLLPNIPPNLINFISIPLPKVENLPDQAESTLDIPLDKVPYLKVAYDSLDTPLLNFLQTSKPDWVIHDFAPYWLPPITSRLGIPSIFFSIFNASFNVFFGPRSDFGKSRTNTDELDVPPEWIPFPSNLAFHKHEILRISNNLEQNVSGVTDLFRFVTSLRGCDYVAIRSSMEFESEWFNLLEEKLLQKPVLPVGLLPPPPLPLSSSSSSSLENVEDEKHKEWVKISEWLDKHERGSVVYIALGTEATLSQQELTELALGLELSGLPFFWVLRMPVGSTKDDPTCLSLPAEFQDRTKGRGFLCMDWAPQYKILGHPSVGCFLTHCGWSSIIEGLVCGCPFVLLPFINDQALIARLLVWKNMGVEIERDEKDGSFTRESVAKTLKMTVLMADENSEGKENKYKAKARELKEILGDKSLNDRYVENFARYLKDHTFSSKCRERKEEDKY